MNYARLNIFNTRVKDEPGAFSEEEIARANEHWEWEQRRLPPHFVPVPEGFTKALDDDELDVLVLAWHIELQRRKDACLQAAMTPRTL